ncbi:MAG: O-antigen ligase family protein [Oscillatoriales cyanobacterium SM2_3_0]|nr:O-antigen ligase family protein [Oscillatoriales cyanobacterium SM2_3_0]
MNQWRQVFFRRVLTPHLEPDLQWAWNSLQIGILTFFLLPTWGAILIVLSVLVTLKQRFWQVIRQPINQVLAVFSGVLVVFSLGSPNPGDAFLGLCNLVPYFLVFAGLSALIQTPNQLRQISRLIVFSIIPITGLGFGQGFLGWSGIESLQMISGWILEPGGSPPGRISSVFIYANLLAAYLVVGFALSLGLLIEQIIQQIWMNSRLKRHSMLKFEPSKLPNKLSISGLGITVIFATIGLILTNSRNAWGLMVILAMAYGVYVGWNWLVMGVIAGVMLIFAAAFAPPFIHQPLRLIVPGYFWQRLTDQNFERPVEILRMTQWKFAWGLTQARPWTGWGLRNFTPLYEAQMNIWLGHPHNLFLMMTAEIGIPLTLVFFSLVGWILVRGVWLWLSWPKNSPDRVILFSFLIGFTSLILFNLFDVTLFDLRINTLGWLLLSAIFGVVLHFQSPTQQQSQLQP